jgi:hypothetical protein
LVKDGYDFSDIMYWSYSVCDHWALKLAGGLR